MSIIKPVQAIIENPVLKNSENIGNNPTGYFNSIIQIAFNLFFIGGIVYFIFQFINGAFHMISSQGDQKKYEDALHTFTHSITGLIVIFSVFVIIKLIGLVFGIKGLDTLTITWPSL